MSATGSTGAPTLQAVTTAGNTTTNSITAQEIYSNGWFRNNNAGTGLYNQSTVDYLYSYGNYWNIRNNSSAGGLRLYDNTWAQKGLLYYDPSGFGLLSSDGNWRVRTNPGYQEFFGDTYANGSLSVGGDIRAGNSDLYFTKTNHNHTGIGNTPGYAAIENAENYNTLMILGRAGTSVGRSVSVWDYLTVNGGQSVTGNLAVGGSATIRNGLDVSNAGGAYTFITLRDDESPNGVKYIHANSNAIGFLSGYGSWIANWDNAGNSWQAGGATIGGNLTVGGSATVRGQSVSLLPPEGTTISCTTPFGSLAQATVYGLISGSRIYSRIIRFSFGTLPPCDSGWVLGSASCTNGNFTTYAIASITGIIVPSGITTSCVANWP